MTWNMLLARLTISAFCWQAGEGKKHGQANCCGQEPVGGRQQWPAHRAASSTHANSLPPTHSPTHPPPTHPPRPLSGPSQTWRGCPPTAGQRVSAAPGAARCRAPALQEAKAATVAGQKISWPGVRLSWGLTLPALQNLRFRCSCWRRFNPGHSPAFFSTRLPSSSTHLSPTTASSSIVTERSRQDWPMVTLRPMVVDAGRPVGTELRAWGARAKG
jgi:hypothetical protein